MNLYFINKSAQVSSLPIIRIVLKYDVHLVETRVLMVELEKTVLILQINQVIS